MKTLKLHETVPKKTQQVAEPGQAPPVGPAPKRLRSASMAPQINPANTRDYGKASPAPVLGLNLGGSI